MSEYPLVRPPGAEKKIPAGVCGILLGGLGIHKFILGYTSEGLVMLLTTLVAVPVITLVTCGFGGILGFVMPTVGLVEGILYLTKTDEEFSQTYVQGQRPWL